MSSTMAKTKNLKTRRYIHGQHLRHFNSFSSQKSVTESFQASIQHNVREFAAKIPNPTLIIAGDRDDITPVEKQYELAKIFPNATIEVLNKVGHLTHYEKPMEVANKIKIFLR
jgi:pimeloyl-ACP methyl ester carboxylesterase